MSAALSIILSRCELLKKVAAEARAFPSLVIGPQLPDRRFYLRFCRFFFERTDDG